MTERMMNMPESMHVVTIHNCFEDGQYFYTLLEACKEGKGRSIESFFSQYTLCDAMEARAQSGRLQPQQPVRSGTDRCAKRGRCAPVRRLPHVL